MVGMETAQTPTKPTWLLAQRWSDLLFAHWPVDPDALAQKLARRGRAGSPRGPSLDRDRRVSDGRDAALGRAEPGRRSVRFPSSTCARTSAFAACPACGF